MMAEMPSYEINYELSTVTINGKQMSFVAWIVSVERRLVEAGVEWPWPERS